MEKWELWIQSCQARDDEKRASVYVLRYSRHPDPVDADPVFADPVKRFHAFSFPMNDSNLRSTSISEQKTQKSSTRVLSPRCNGTEFQFGGQSPLSICRMAIYSV